MDFGEIHKNGAGRSDGVRTWLRRLGRWWRERERVERRRQAKRRLFVLESLTVGPRQRVVLMRCGGERFLVGLAADGVRTIVPVKPRSDRATDQAKSQKQKLGNETWD